MNDSVGAAPDPSALALEAAHIRDIYPAVANIEHHIGIDTIRFHHEYTRDAIRRVQLATEFFRQGVMNPGNAHLPSPVPHALTDGVTAHLLANHDAYVENSLRSCASLTQMYQALDDACARLDLALNQTVEIATQDVFDSLLVTRTDGGYRVGPARGDYSRREPSGRIVIPANLASVANPAHLEIDRRMRVALATLGAQLGPSYGLSARMV